MRGFRDLKVYQLAYRLAMEIFEESKTFPEDERSSRSVAVNIAEGFRKRRYPNMFASKMADADAEATETQVRLDFALDCEYMTKEKHAKFISAYEEGGKMLGVIIEHPERFAPQ